MVTIFKYSNIANYLLKLHFNLLIKLAWSITRHLKLICFPKNAEYKLVWKRKSYLLLVYIYIYKVPNYICMCIYKWGSSRHIYLYLVFVTVCWACCSNSIIAWNLESCQTNSIHNSVYWTKKTTTKIWFFYLAFLSCRHCRIF